MTALSMWYYITLPYLTLPFDVVFTLPYRTLPHLIFICDHCTMKRENNEASTIKEQILELTKVVKNLAGEIKNMKAENHKIKGLSKSNEHITQWSNTDRVKKMKASLCIRSNGVPVDMEKIQNIVTNNGIQVIKTVVIEKGDVYVNHQKKTGVRLPSFLEMKFQLIMK